MMPSESELEYYLSAGILLTIVEMSLLLCCMHFESRTK